MATIKVGPKFFRKERDNLYTDWPTAYWREMFQNSGDAGARRIIVGIKPLFGGCRVSFCDNGHGMNRSVLENVFFALGETTKGESSDGVGGFGRARILTCFAMESYTIRTQNLFVKGSASEYSIEETGVHYGGCDFEIDIADKSAESMTEALKKVLSRSQLDDIIVEVNGVRWTDWMYRRRLTRELDCGGVYVNKSQSSNNEITVRVKGLYMFDLYASTKAQVIVEIDPKKSRSILTVNRDGLHYRYQSNLTQFLAEIAIDKTSALRSRNRKTKLIRGLGFTTTRSDRKMFRSDPGTGKTAGVVVPMQVAAAAAQSHQMPASRPVSIVESEVVEGAAFATGLPSIYINDETENPLIIRVISNFDPTKWVHAVKNVRGKQQKYRKGSTYLKLLLVWRAAVEEAIRALLSQSSFDSISWLVGWDFNDDAEASHVGVDGGHAICLNPVDSEGNLRYKISSRESLMALMALAKHEVAHVVAKFHDEDFSTLHTGIDKEFNPWSALRRMKDAIASVN